MSNFTCLFVNLKMSNKQIQGFKVLPLKFSTSSTSYYDIFFKEHNVRNQSSETPTGCTLFVLNIPPYAMEESIQNVFSGAGPVRKVLFSKQPQDDTKTLNLNGFKIAYVVFKKRESLLNALKLNELQPLSTSEKPIVCGVQKWIQEYNQSVPDVKVLQKEINDYMLQYDKRMEKEKKLDAEKRQEDEDGWITVTKHGRTPGLARKQTVEQKIKEKIAKRKKKKELKNFYTFQIRDSKMKHIASLRQKFEEDKQKINAMKQARRFKPF